MARRARKDRIIVSGPTGTAADRLLHSCLQELATTSLDEGELLEAACAKETKVLAFYGSSPGPLQRILGRGGQAREVLTGKLVYSLTGLPMTKARAAISNGAAGYIGHQHNLWILSPPSPLAKRSLIEGLCAIMEGSDCGGVADRIRSAFMSAAIESLSHMLLDLRERREGGVHAGFLGAVSSMHNRDSLVHAGGESWRIRPNADVVLVPTASLGPAPKSVLGLNFTLGLIHILRQNPERIRELSAEELEELVCERLLAMGFKIHRVSPTFVRDGGIDLLAWREDVPFASFIAVQVKQSRRRKGIGPRVVRELQGVLVGQPLDVGLIVTNARFTPSAKWAARHEAKIVRLRDLEDLKRWILDDFSKEQWSRDFPESVKLAEDIEVPVPQMMGTV